MVPLVLPFLHLVVCNVTVFVVSILSPKPNHVDTSEEEDGRSIEEMDTTSKKVDVEEVTCSTDTSLHS